ncbi:MAG: leucyl aminopeptidase [Planctomycetota bacterium]
MEIYVNPSSLAGCGEPVLAVGVFESAGELPSAVSDLDEAIGGLISRVLSEGDFLGKTKEVTVLYAPPTDDGPQRVILYGLGKRDKVTVEAVRKAAGEVAVRARGLRAGSVAFALPAGDALPADEQARAIVEASLMALYQYDRYRTEKPEDAVPVEKLTLVVEGDDDLGPSVANGRIAAECSNFCRDLQNTHPGEATPAWMAEQAETMAAEVGLDVTVLEADEMAEAGMGGLLGVGQGSAQPPKMVILEHNAGKGLDTVCLVGKGVTFDTGGISLKPGLNMHEMKFDKSGACAVIAAMRGAALLDVPVHVVGIACLVENMPSSNAYRPGDVLTCSNGKTIEIQNTDAEGRLILADGLVKATSYEPKAIVDLATLTGACVIALGDQYAAILGNDDDLAAKLIEAGQTSGERLWRLPLGPEYREQIKSDVADMKNIGGRAAGTITAACLLEEFVGDCKWAHLDIAGKASRDSDRDYLRKGGTGFGTRILMEFLSNYEA